MTRIAVLAVVVTGVAGCGDEHAAPTPAARSSRVVVAYVNDGDTLRLTDGRRVRLVQIDAPELETECYGRAARRALIRLAPPGTRVTLERDPALDAVDRYGRILRYLLVDGRNVNLQLVAEGAAEPYFFHGDRGRLASAFLAAAVGARARRVGLWRSCPNARLVPVTGAGTGPA